MKSKCYEFQQKKPESRPQGTAFQQTYKEAPGICFDEYRKLMYNYHERSEYQVIVLAWYYWGGNNAQCVKLDPLVTVPLDFTVMDPGFQRAKEK